LAQHSAETVSEEHPENDRTTSSWILVEPLGVSSKTDSVVRYQNRTGNWLLELVTRCETLGMPLYVRQSVPRVFNCE